MDEFGRRIVIGVLCGIALGLTFAILAWFFAPPIKFPGDLAWLNVYGRVGVSLASGFLGFFICWFFTVLSFIAGIGSEF